VIESRGFHRHRVSCSGNRGRQLLSRELALVWLGITVSLAAFAGAASANVTRKASPGDQVATVASKFTRVGRGQLIADSRYVLVWGTNAKGVLTDTQTGHTTTVSEPGCSSAAAIGGLSIVFACNGPSYELFNITTGRSAELRLNLSVVANGKVTAVGADWLALAASCEMEHCGSTQFFYQSLSDGTIAPDPSAGSTTVDLDSPTLSHTLCSPVTVPSAPSYPFDHYGAASILVDGRFAVSTSGGGSYLARCGSQLHQFLTYTSYPGCAHETCAPPANSNLIVWQSAPLRLSGIFLPTRHPFVIALPAEIDPTPGPYVNGDRYALALTSHALYVAHNGSVWMARARRSHRQGELSEWSDPPQRRAGPDCKHASAQSANQVGRHRAAEEAELRQGPQGAEVEHHRERQPDAARQAAHGNPGGQVPPRRCEDHDLDPSRRCGQRQAAAHHRQAQAHQTNRVAVTVTETNATQISTSLSVRIK
jgi:hypothetical protein